MIQNVNSKAIIQIWQSSPQVFNDKMLLDNSFNYASRKMANIYIYFISPTLSAIVMNCQLSMVNVNFQLGTSRLHR